jgi:hypothetical protein
VWCDFYGCGLKGIRLNHVDNRFKLLFGHGRIFSVLLRTFGVQFLTKKLVYFEYSRDASNVRPVVKIIYLF